MEEMMLILKGIKGKMEKQEQDLKDMKETIIHDINTNVNKMFKNLEIKVTGLEKNIEEQQIALDRLEQHMKKKNIIFFGVNEQEKSYQELEDIVLKIITHKMKIVCDSRDIESLRRIGKRSDKVRPITVTLSTLGLKIKVLKNRKYLENSPIYIKEDFTPKILQKRKELHEEFRTRKEQGESIALRYDRIITLPSRNQQSQPSSSIHPSPIQAHDQMRNQKRKQNPSLVSKSTQRNSYQNAKKNRTIQSYMHTRTNSLIAETEATLSDSENEEAQQ